MIFNKIITTLIILNNKNRDKDNFVAVEREGKQRLLGKCLDSQGGDLSCEIRGCDKHGI